MSGAADRLLEAWRGEIEAGAVYDLAVAAGDEWCIGELAFWMWRAGSFSAEMTALRSTLRRSS